jgi:uncharacterized membrane protein
MGLELALTLLALGASLWMRPWRMLGAGSALLSPMMASVVLFPWLWALPNLHHMPLQLHWSGAPLITLMLGWPLAVLTFTAIGAITTVISTTNAEAALSLVVWQGLVPATFTLLLGAGLRRWVSHHPFVYVLGRGFLGAVLCIFLSSMLAQALGHEVPYVSNGLSMMGLWLMAWGDAFVTGMICAIFIAYRPQWLATWSDQMYLKV